MVQDVSEDTLEFQRDALRHTDLLGDAEIHIPIVEPSYRSVAVVSCIQAQDRVTPVHSIHGTVRERVDWVSIPRCLARAGWNIRASGCGHAVVSAGVQILRIDGYSVLRIVISAAYAIARAEGLEIRERCRNLDGKSRTRSKD